MAQNIILNFIWTLGPGLHLQAWVWKILTNHNSRFFSVTAWKRTFRGTRQQFHVSYVMFVYVLTF